MIDVDVTTRGTVPPAQAARASALLGELDRCVPDPVLGARVMLRCESNPRLERPARAEAEVDVNGRLVCGRVAAGTMAQAVGELVERLERQLQDFAGRRERLRRRAPQPRAGEWRHGAPREPRPDYFPRPPAERQLIRRKTFAVQPLEPLQAVTEMLDLDHDFYLFRDARTGTDAVVHRREDGRIGLLDHAGPSAPAPTQDGLMHESSRLTEPITLEQAISEMDALSHRFMYFTDARTGRGTVIYMRYDGHYGVIESAA